MHPVYVSAAAAMLLLAACHADPTSADSGGTAGHGVPPTSSGIAEPAPAFVWPPPPPPAVSAEDARCRALGETACMGDPHCRAYLDSSYCTPDYCTEDLQFHYCVAAAPGAAEAAAVRRERCAETGGAWRVANPVEDSTCNCASVAADTAVSDGPVHESWLGCASYRELCTARGAQWRRIDNVREIVVHGEMSPEECRDGHRHSARYDAATRLCTYTVNGHTCFVNGAEISDENELLARPQ